MSSFTAEVVSGGRVTIPSTIRDKMDIEEGNAVELELKDVID